jgi:hypothetical protein
VSKSRATRSDYDKEIAKLKLALRAVARAIADFERLESKSPSKVKVSRRQNQVLDSGEEMFERD